MDKMTKVLLAVIGLGLWVNAAIPLMRPAQAQQQQSAFSQIANDLHHLVQGGAHCLNKKLCD